MANGRRRDVLAGIAGMAGMLLCIGVLVGGPSGLKNAGVGVQDEGPAVTLPDPHAPDTGQTSGTLSVAATLVHK